MNARNLVLSSALLFPLFSIAPLQAQRVNADIRIGGGPVSGRIVIDDRGRDRYRSRPRPIGRIEWIRARDYRRNDWFRNFRRDARVIVIFYDRRDDRYYRDRFDRGLEEIRVFERDGRYYRLENDGRDYDDRRYDDRRHNDRDRDGRDRDGRDDRWNDRDHQ
jgi:hypothetical protein